MNYPYVASRVFNTPLLMMESKAQIIGNYIAKRMGYSVEGIQDTFDEILKDETEASVSNIAVIGVQGSLIQKGNYVNGESGLTSYDAIAAQLDEAMADTKIDGILLNCDSPGGEVAGCFDLADRIYEASTQKPIVAYVGELAASAGYAIASAANKIVVPRSGFTGSVGVVMNHLDISEAMADAGVVVTHIFAGSHKVDGNQFQKLSDEAKAMFQADIDQLYSIFTETVARNRDMSVDAVRATEAQVFLGERNVEIGFADAVGTMDDALSLLIESTGSLTTRGGLMSKTTTASAEAPEVTASAEVETIDVDALSAKASDEGRAAERERIQQIMGSDEAKNAPAQAEHFAYKTAMSPEDALAALALVEAQPQPAANTVDPLGLAMASEEQPNIGADISTDHDELDPAAECLKDFGAVTGQSINAS